MRKALLVIFSAISFLALQACGNGGNSSGTHAQGAQMEPSVLPRNTSPDAPASDTSALIAGNTAFATDLYAALRNAPLLRKRNIFFSPYSISLALAMIYAGADGATASELKNTLHFTLPNSRVHAAFNALDLALTVRPPTKAGKAPLTLRFANSLWGEKQTTFKQPFLNTLATDYGASVHLVDFRNTPDTARTNINDWIAIQTENKILNLLSPGSVSSATRSILVNAAYFHGRWRAPFRPQDTTPSAFHGINGNTTVQMMKQQTEASYGAGNGWRAIVLHYDDNLAFTAILPDNLATFESSLNAATLARINSSLDYKHVKLTMPKFTLPGITLSLKDPLQALGTKKLFTANADLSGISADQPPLFVDDVLHQAYIKVDEEGTEAAAATAVGLSATANAYPPPPVILTLDKPFVFFISDTTNGAILFMGRYVGA